MQILISITLALIMLGIGLSIKWVDFRKLFNNKTSVFLGLFLQMVFLPLLAFVIATVSGLSNEFKVGLFIVSICPGGTTSNFISYIVKADVVLSVFLTCVNSIFILVTIPVLTSFSMDFFMSTSHNISILSTFEQIFYVLFIPVVLGIMINERFSNLVNIKKSVRIISSILLVLVFGIKFLAKENSGGSNLSIDDIITLLPYCLLLHFISMFFSYFMSKKIIKSKLQALTIAIEVGVQNTTLSLLITGELIKNVNMTKPTLIFAIFSFFSTLIFAILKTKKNIRAINSSH